MPTHDELPQFIREYLKLTEDEQDRFLKAMKHLVQDLRSGSVLRPGLRVKGVQGHTGVSEMTWAPDGRATFAYGPEQIPGEKHIIWRRIGSHEILQNP
jgi:hypothetical protein